MLTLPAKQTQEPNWEQAEKDLALLKSKNTKPKKDTGNLVTDFVKAPVRGIARLPDVVGSGIESAASGYGKIADLALDNENAGQGGAVEQALVSGVGKVRDVTTRPFADAVDEALPYSQGTQAAQEQLNKEIADIQSQKDKGVVDRGLESFGAALSNPRGSLPSVLESVPQFLAGSAALKGAGVAAGLNNAGGVAGKIGQTGAIVGIGNAALEGEGAERGARQEMQSLSDDKLRENPQFRELEAKYGIEEARRIATEQAGINAYGTAALTGAGAAALTGGGLEGALLRRVEGVAPRVAGGVVKETLKGAGKEGLEELSQGYTGQVAQNLAMQPYTGVAWDEGAAEQAGMGAGMGVISGGVGGATGATYDKFKPATPTPTDTQTNQTNQTNQTEQTEQTANPPVQPEATQQQTPPAPTGNTLADSIAAQQAVNPNNYTVNNNTGNAAPNTQQQQTQTQETPVNTDNTTTNNITPEPQSNNQSSIYGDSGVQPTTYSPATLNLANSIVNNVDSAIQNNAVTDSHIQDVINAAQALDIPTENKDADTIFNEVKTKLAEEQTKTINPLTQRSGFKPRPEPKQQPVQPNTEDATNDSPTISPQPTAQGKNTDTSATFGTGSQEAEQAGQSGVAFNENDFLQDDSGVQSDDLSKNESIYKDDSPYPVKNARKIFKKIVEPALDSWKNKDESKYIDVSESELLDEIDLMDSLLSRGRKLSRDFLSETKLFGIMPEAIRASTLDVYEDANAEEQSAFISELKSLIGRKQKSDNDETGKAVVNPIPSPPSRDEFFENLNSKIENNSFLLGLSDSNATSETKNAAQPSPSVSPTATQEQQPTTQTQTATPNDQSQNETAQKADTEEVKDQSPDVFTRSNRDNENEDTDTQLNKLLDSKPKKPSKDASDAEWESYGEANLSWANSVKDFLLNIKENGKLIIGDRTFEFSVDSTGNLQIFDKVADKAIYNPRTGKKELTTFLGLVLNNDNIATFIPSEQKTDDIFYRSDRSNDSDNSRTALVANENATGRKIQQVVQNTNLPTFENHPDIQSLNFDAETLKNAQEAIEAISKVALDRRQAKLEEEAFLSDLEYLATLPENKDRITVEQKNGNTIYTVKDESGNVISTFTRAKDQIELNFARKKARDKLRNELVAIGGGKWDVESLELVVQPLDVTAVNAMREEVKDKVRDTKDIAEKLNIARQAHSRIRHFDDVIKKLKAIFLALFNRLKPENKRAMMNDDKRSYKWRNNDNTVMFTIRKGRGKFKLSPDTDIKGNTPQERAKNLARKQVILDRIAKIEANQLKRGEIEAKSAYRNADGSADRAVRVAIGDNPVLLALFEQTKSEKPAFDGFEASQISWQIPMVSGQSNPDLSIYRDLKERNRQMAAWANVAKEEKQEEEAREAEQPQPTPNKAKKAKPEETKPSNQGQSKNTVFTEEMANAARERLRAKLGRLNSGVDPEMFADGIVLAGYHIEKGARAFADYVKAMVDDMGDDIKPYLKQFYYGVKSDPRAGAFAKDMDKLGDVEEADIDEILAKTDTTQQPEASTKNEEVSAEVETEAGKNANFQKASNANVGDWIYVFGEKNIAPKGTVLITIKEMQVTEKKTRKRLIISSSTRDSTASHWSTYNYPRTIKSYDEIGFDENVIISKDRLPDEKIAELKKIATKKKLESLRGTKYFPNYSISSQFPDRITPIKWLSKDENSQSIQTEPEQSVQEQAKPQPLQDLIRAQDLPVVLDHIIESKSSFSGIARTLKNKLPANLKFEVVPELKAEKNEKRDVPSKFSKNDGNGNPIIRINEKYLSSKDKDLMQFVLHEVAHAETVFALENDKLFRAQLNGIIKAIAAHAEKTNGVLTAKGNDGKTYEMFRVSRLFKDAENTEPNAEELVAYGLTDPRFQVALQEIPYDDNISVWDKFVDAVARVLGVQVKGKNADKTALAAVLRLSMELVEEQAKANGQSISEIDSKLSKIANQYGIKKDDLRTMLDEAKEIIASWSFSKTADSEQIKEQIENFEKDGWINVSALSNSLRSIKQYKQDSSSYEKQAKQFYDEWKKARDKLDKLDSSGFGEDYQNKGTKAKRANHVVNAANYGAALNNNRNGLKDLLRERLKNNLPIDKKYLDVVGSIIDYDENGNYAPIANKALQESVTEQSTTTEEQSADNAQSNSSEIPNNSEQGNQPTAEENAQQLDQQPYEMVYSDFSKAVNLSSYDVKEITKYAPSDIVTIAQMKKFVHKYYIKQAIDSGKVISDAVLADYPELQQQQKNTIILNGKEIPVADVFRQLNTPRQSSKMREELKGHPDEERIMAIHNGIKSDARTGEYKPMLQALIELNPVGHREAGKQTVFIMNC